MSLWTHAPYNLHHLCPYHCKIPVPTPFRSGIKSLLLKLCIFQSGGDLTSFSQFFLAVTKHFKRRKDLFWLVVSVFGPGLACSIAVGLWWGWQTMVGSIWWSQVAYFMVSRKQRERKTGKNQGQVPLWAYLQLPTPSPTSQIFTTSPDCATSWGSAFQYMWGHFTFKPYHPRSDFLKSHPEMNWHFTLLVQVFWI
jgi:hypothetical protein